jgi:octaprenyl-diphosphate synthase
LVKNHEDKPDKINQIIDFVRNSGGLAYAEEQMMQYQDQAFAILNTFPDSESKRSLAQLVEFTTQRKK